MLFLIECSESGIGFQDFYIIEKESFEETIEYVKNKYDKDLELDEEIEKETNFIFLESYEYSITIDKIVKSNEEMKNEIQKILNSNNKLDIAFLSSCLKRFKIG